MQGSPKNNCTTGLHVAIVGAGISGVTLALGLQARGVSYVIYERASGFKEIGAGIGFSPNAENALISLDKRIHEAYKRVATPNGEDYFQWIHGQADELIYKLFVGHQGFQGCRRSDFLYELAKMIPTEKVKFDKQVDLISEAKDGEVTLRFVDGTTESADAGKSSASL
jgi:salicylate hydroxylase